MESQGDEVGFGSVHIPVLVEEVKSALVPAAGMVFMDATVGAGGHAEALLAGAGGDLTYIGLDQDAEILEVARQRLAPFGEKVRLFHSRFSDLEQVVAKAGLRRVDGILFDLGVSSLALDSAERGFGFMVSGPLDMRMDRDDGETAAQLVARLSAADLAALIFDYGEDRFAKRIAAAIVKARRYAPILTTTRLAEIVARAVPHLRSRLHPATRTFQALRIAVNRELDQLREGLEAAHAVLSPGGRVVVISFHSLEDRIVKQFFRTQMKPLVKKPLRPTPEEVSANRRARSARLRVATSTGVEP